MLKLNKKKSKLEVVKDKHYFILSSMPSSIPPILRSLSPPLHLLLISLICTLTSHTLHAT